MKKIHSLILAFAATWCIAVAQQNFSYTPIKPKPGDLITISYTPAGDLADTQGEVEAIVYLAEKHTRKAEDLSLKKKGKSYTATILTDTADNFIQLGFYVDKKFDNNFNDGYYIHLYEGDKIRRGSFTNLAYFYRFDGEETHVARNNEKALAALDKEISLYPEEKKRLLGEYVRVLFAIKPNEAMLLAQTEIEEALMAGLKTEKDYQQVQKLYNAVNLSKQAEWISSVKKEKFPEGIWKIEDVVNRFSNETDVIKKSQMFTEIEKNVKTNPDWKRYEKGIAYFRSQVISIHIQNKDWTSFKKIVSAIPHSEGYHMASAYNKAAWTLQEEGGDLKIAEEFARIATDYGRSQIKTTVVPRPSYLTEKQWTEQRKQNYATYANTYATVLYRLGNFKNAHNLITETAFDIHHGLDADQNNSYALIAEKVLPANELKPQLEKFVRQGNSTSEIKDVLKRIYMKEKGNEGGFEQYIAALNNELYLKMVEDVKKSMINEVSPSFKLNDLEGKPVTTESLKGKTIVLDFWATWCGPCISSFPGMQKVVDKYRNNPNVKFLFVNTWERAKDKQAIVSAFMRKHHYSFDVLMDNEGKVADQFKVEGIPAKFVIDKEGRIRFKSAGSGSEDSLINELSVMIEMASGEKTF